MPTKKLTPNRIDEVVFRLRWHNNPAFIRRDLEAVHYILAKFPDSYLLEANVRKFQFDNPNAVLQCLSETVDFVCAK